MTEITEPAVSAFEHAHEASRGVVVDHSRQAIDDGRHLLAVMLHDQHEFLDRHDSMVAPVTGGRHPGDA